ncbi:MAG TPA: lysylphosphatidylglycerol synthase transmembrane domain-containing protein [Candidatus Binatia bacterium]|nr:lysylphosphatidylglycerol synthase transmembrane domain-containing protein [Candidatus Binatia bacterium]
MNGAHTITATSARTRRWWLGLGVGLILVVAVAWRVHPLAVLRQAIAADPALFMAALAAYLASQGASALRLAMLARGAGYAVPLERVVQIHAAGAFFGLVAPTTLGNDACRVLYLGRETPNVARAVSVVLFDRLQGLVVLGAVGAVAALLVVTVVLPPGVARAVGAFGTTAVLGGVLVVGGARWVRPEHPIRRALGDAIRAPRLLAATSVVSAVIVGLQIASQALLASSIGVHVPLAHVAVYHPLVVLGGTLPITFAGLGTREATYLWMLGPAGVAAESALAWSVLWLAVGILNGLVGGLIVLASRMPSPGTRAGVA